MSDPGKEKTDKGNSLDIPGILADFFLKKIDMPYTSNDSDHLHKSKRKKSKHKKRKHKKSKHSHRSSSSDSASELNIKGVDDVSSSEEMEIKRLKKIKSIKMQSMNNFVLKSTILKESEIKETDAQSNYSTVEKPVFYGPSLELLLSGANNSSNLDSNSNLSPKYLSSNDKKETETETKADFKETEKSIQGMSNENKEAQISNSHENYLDCDAISSGTKESYIIDNVANNAQNSIPSNAEGAKENDLKKYDSQLILEDCSKANMCFNDSETIMKNNKSESNVMKDDSKVEVKEENSKMNINENISKTYLEGKVCENDVKEEKSENDSKKTSSETSAMKLHDFECNKSDDSVCKSLPVVNEVNKIKLKEDSKNSNSINNEKTKSDINHEADANNNCVVKPKKNKDSKKKHSRSHSRSVSLTNHVSSRSKHKKHRSRSTSRGSKHRRQRSRSSSRGSYHSKQRKRRHSRSRSYSHEKKRSRNYRKRSFSRSYSRSRSRSRYQRNKRRSQSRSPHRRYNHRHSRSRSYTRSKESSKLKTKRHSKSRERYSSGKSSRRSRSKKHLSHSKSRSRSKSRHKSLSPKKSHSRSKSKEKKSSTEKANKIDQAKILETARKNVLQMIKKGTLPEGLPVENLKKEQLFSVQAGGKSVQELTDFCQRLSQKENEPENSDNEENDDKADDETGFIHHPFKVKEPGMIKLNIKNAIQLPIKTHAQKIAETTRLSSQFPVSSGNKHKQKELEWVPVVPESSKTETKSTAKTVSTIAETSSAIVAMPESTVQPIPPPPPPLPTPPPPLPVAYPCPPPTEVATIPTSMPNIPSNVPMPSIPLPPAPLPIQSTTVYQPPQPMFQSYEIPNQQMMSFSTASASTPSTSIFKPPKKLDIASIVTKRFQALQKLTENPNDIESLRILQEAQESIQEWVESQQVPGLFTGSTDAKLLTAAELCGPFKHHKIRKDILSHAPPVTEGKGMSLLKKMGWNPGEGLGKNKEGSLEPLVLDIKTDKKGLVSEGENSKKGISSFLKDLQGKHPVSALMELCSKRRWKPPLYTCVLDEGPSHKKLFCFKVEVNDVEYQPVNPCSNKKVAKADAAVLCLQSLNVLPKST